MNCIEALFLGQIEPEDFIPPDSPPYKAAIEAADQAELLLTEKLKETDKKLLCSYITANNQVLKNTRSTCFAGCFFLLSVFTGLVHCTGLFCI